MILNLSTGNYFSGYVSELDYGLPPMIFTTKEDVEFWKNLIVETSKRLTMKSKIRTEHLEIIEIKTEKEESYI